MKIGISTSVVQRGQTGIAQYVFALLRGLKACGRDHQFALFVLEEDEPLFESVADTMEIIRVSEFFRSPIKNILWHQAVLPQLIRRHGIDVLHVPSYRRMVSPRVCPRVVTIHDLAPFLVSEKYDRKRMFYGKVVAKHLARRQDEIIAISHNTAGDLRKYFKLESDNISVVYNGLDHERFSPGSRAEAKAALEQKCGIKEPFFLYVARLEHPAKNHVRLILAFNTFKAETNSNWKLVLGGADWNGAEVIHETIAKSRVKNDIHCLGFVSDRDLPSLYRAADVFVYPSLYEGFGMPPIEAMACGCPVISSGRGSLAEVVGDAAAIIDPENVVQLKNALVTLAGSESERDRLRSLGLQQAKLFNWEKSAEATMAVYQRAAARTRNVPQISGQRTTVSVKGPELV